ncbi:MAG: helix-turn-helix domain-containing protein [Acidobacteriota bacterium]
MKNAILFYIGLALIVAGLLLAADSLSDVKASSKSPEGGRTHGKASDRPNKIAPVQLLPAGFPRSLALPKAPGEAHMPSKSLKFITLTELSALGILPWKESKLRRMARADQIPHYDFGRRLRFVRKEIEVWVASRRRGPDVQMDLPMAG